MNNLCVLYRQLEENINKWSLELEDMEKVFLNQATMVNAWDQMLIKNGAKIVSLNESVAAVRADQQRLEHELDFVASQVCKKKFKVLSGICVMWGWYEILCYQI